MLKLFGAGLFLSLALESIEYLFPARTFWSPLFRGQLQGFSHLALTRLIVLPGLPALLWLGGHSPRVRGESRLAAAALGAWILAAVLLGLALVTGTLEANWMVALDHPQTAGRVGLAQLLSILSGCLSAEIFLLLLLAPMGGLPRNREPERVCRLVGARLAALAVPLIGACAFLAAVGKLTGLSLSSLEGNGWVYTFVNALTWMPLQTGLLLLALGRILTELRPESPVGGLPPAPHLHRIVVGLGFLSVFAFESTRFPGALPPGLHLGLMGLQGAVAAHWLSLGFLLLPRWLLRPPPMDAARWTALGGLLWIGALVPTQFWIHLRADFSGSPANPWITVRDTTLWLGLGATMVAMIQRRSAPPAHPDPARRCAKGALVCGVLFWLALIGLAATHYPVRIATYPPELLIPHAALFLTAACGVGLGLLGSLRRP